MYSAPSFALPLFFLAACGGNVVVDGNGGVTASGGSGGVIASGGTGGTGGVITVTCLDGAPLAFPPSFKVCSATSDCTIQDIPGCCSAHAVGIAAGQVQGFDAYEQACTNHGFKCNCTGPPIAEDGKTGNIQVECQNGLCSTYVP